MTDEEKTTDRATQKRGHLLVVFLAVFIDLLGFGIVLPLLPIYAKYLTSDSSGMVLGLLMASYSAMQFLFAPLWGRLSDRIGRRPILMLGLLGSVIFYALFGIASSMGSLLWMFVSRIGAGIAGATIPTAQAYIADTTSKENRAKGMALIGAAFGLGFTFGPLLAATALISSGEAQAHLSPWPGFTASILSAGALLLAFFKLPESLRPDSLPAEHRLLNLSALHTAVSIPTVGTLLLISFVSVLSFSGFESVLSVLLKTDVTAGGFGYGLVEVLMLFAGLGFVHALAQGLVRGMSSHMSETRLATGGAAVAILGYVLLVVAIDRQSLGLLIGAMAVEAVGFAFLPPTVQALISRRSDPGRQGSILGVAQSVSAMARILGHAICFPLFYIATTIPFVVGAALMAVALLLIATIARRGGDFGHAVKAAEPEPVGEGD